MRSSEVQQKSHLALRLNLLKLALDDEPFEPILGDHLQDLPYQLSREHIDAPLFVIGHQRRRIRVALGVGECYLLSAEAGFVLSQTAERCSEGKKRRSNGYDA